MKENAKLEEQLKAVSGGLASEFLACEEIFKENVPAELLESVKGLKNDNEILKSLAEKNVHLESLEKKLPDSALDKIYGGYEDILGRNIYCPCCSKGDPDNFSVQIWKSITDNTMTYRCKSCNIIFHLDDNLKPVQN